MPQSQNMKRLRRGEISRVNAQKGIHTDVHFGSPPENTPAAGTTGEASNQKLLEKISKLEAENAELKKEQADLDDQQKGDYVKLTAKLDAATVENEKLVADRDELERQLAEQEKPEPVTGLRVLKVLEVNEADDLLRIDCELKPTEGPLGSTGAIILPVSEVEKLIEEETSEEDGEG